MIRILNIVHIHISIINCFDIRSPIIYFFSQSRHEQNSLHLMCALMEYFLQAISPSAFNFVKKMLTTAQIFCNQFGNSRFYCGIIKNNMAKMIDDFDFYNFFQTLIHIKVKCMCKRPTSKICPLFP